MIRGPCHPSRTAGEHAGTRTGTEGGVDNKCKGCELQINEAPFGERSGFGKNSGVKRTQARSNLTMGDLLGSWRVCATQDDG